MREQNKLSLWTAILVNISVMFGVGVFINTVVLAQRAGGLGFLSYLLIALLMTPLIISIGKLLEHYPSGGFYAYAAPISPLAGFVSAWSYFIGKLASASLIITVFSRLIKTMLPVLEVIPTWTLNLSILLFFTLLNMLNVKTNLSVIYTFVVLKLIPIITAIITSLFLWQHWSLPTETLYWSKIPSSIPFVLFAFTGFEAACSISRVIKDPTKNAPKSIFYSFSFVVFITILYQLLFFLPLGTTLMAQSNYLGAFPSLFTLLFPTQPLLVHGLTTILHICLAAAALGGSYGILFSNPWNLYILAENNHTFMPKLITRVNKYQMPIICILIESLVCSGYLLLTHGNQLLLQQISVLSCAISFTFSIVAYLYLQRKNQAPSMSQVITYLALGSCALFLGTCINNLVHDAPWGLGVFILLISMGMCMFKITQKK